MWWWDQGWRWPRRAWKIGWLFVSKASCCGIMKHFSPSRGQVYFRVVISSICWQLDLLVRSRRALNSDFFYSKIQVRKHFETGVVNVQCSGSSFCPLHTHIKLHVWNSNRQVVHNDDDNKQKKKRHTHTYTHGKLNKCESKCMSPAESDYYMCVSMFTVTFTVRISYALVCSSYHQQDQIPTTTHKVNFNSFYFFFFYHLPPISQLFLHSSVSLTFTPPHSHSSSSFQ